MPEPGGIGIIGGSGALGAALARGMLQHGGLDPARLWISNRSGSRAGFGDWPAVRCTARNQELVDACGLVVLSVPPHLLPEVGIDAAGRLVVSVMAGVPAASIGQATGATRIVRAMSSPAAALGLAYSPWWATGAVTGADRAAVRRLFEPCGLTDEVPDEAQIDLFTALTGPVPGFVACYADCMAEWATRRGVDPAVAVRAVRQLFRAAGVVLAAGPTPAEHVREMIDYAGTTAAGLEAMRAAPLADAIARGLDAAVERTRGMA